MVCKRQGIERVGERLLASWKGFSLRLWLLFIVMS